MRKDISDRTWGIFFELTCHMGTFFKAKEDMGGLVTIDNTITYILL